VIENTGFMIDGSVFHPGDSFTVPQDPVQTLLLPGQRAVAQDRRDDRLRARGGPRARYVIHDALFGDVGLMVLATSCRCAGRKTASRGSLRETTIEI